MKSLNLAFKHPWHWVKNVTSEFVETFNFYFFPSIFRLKLMILFSISFLFYINSFAVNLGGLLLQALLEYWPRTHVNPIDEEENEVNHGSCFYIRIIDLKITQKLRILRLCVILRMFFKKNYFKHLLKCDIVNICDVPNLLPSLPHPREHPSSLN